MKVLLFGQQLVESGHISKEDLDKAMALQRAGNRRIGELAVAMGLLSEEQAAHINQLQSCNNKRFGDLASDLGLLTNEQLVSLLDQQKHQHCYIGEILVREGMLSQQQLDDELGIHQAQNQQAAQALDETINNHPLGKLLQLSIALTKNIFLRVIKCNCSYRSMVSNSSDASVTLDNCVHIYVSGDLAFTLGIAADDDAMLNIASAFVDMEKHQCELDFASDAFGELLNILLGQMLKEVVVDGMSYEHSTPDTSRAMDSLVFSNETGLAVEMNSELGQFVLLISENSKK